MHILVSFIIAILAATTGNAEGLKNQETEPTNLKSCVKMEQPEATHPDTYNSLLEELENCRNDTMKLAGGYFETLDPKNLDVVAEQVSLIESIRCETVHQNHDKRPSALTSKTLESKKVFGNSHIEAALYITRVHSKYFTTTIPGAEFVGWGGKFMDKINRVDMLYAIKEMPITSEIYALLLSGCFEDINLHEEMFGPYLAMFPVSSEEYELRFMLPDYQTLSSKEVPKPAFIFNIGETIFFCHRETESKSLKVFKKERYSEIIEPILKKIDQEKEKIMQGSISTVNTDSHVEDLEKAAQSDNSEAQFQIGCLLLNNGENIFSSDIFEWFNKAAQQGHTRAQATVGFCYFKGLGVRQNYEEGAKWYRKAAEKGNAEAQHNLGKCYCEGLGVEKNTQEAILWYRRAAEQGNQHAQHSLGVVYSIGHGVEKNLKEAVFWWHKAAESGEPLAQFSLGISYFKGQGVDKNLQEAVFWYKKAAEQGDVRAQCNLGHCYYSGQGIEQNLQEAATWFRKAAEQGDVDAQFNLGVIYVKGRGVEKDLVEAAKWYRKAAEQGDADAANSLNSLEH